MDCRMRNADWKDDEKLEEDLKRYVAQNLRRTEILDFVKREYPEYAWSLRTLNRRLSYFKIRYNDYDTDLNEVENAVRQEMDGPGAFLGYRALHKKIREVHGLKVPRNIVYDMMYMVDPTGLDERGGVGQPKRPRRTRKFTSKGSDWTMSLDGHDKLCGFQKATFPLCIYGGLDTFSSKVHFLKLWTTNNDPDVVGRIYLEHLYSSKVLPARIRMDHGTETGVMATMHCFLRDQQGDLEDATDSLLFGPSTENRIERFWKELLERMERYFKDQLKKLLDDGEYDRENSFHRNLVAYVYIPVIQKELDTFRETIWNNHRGRKQKDKLLPTGIPEHIYNFPEQYGGEQCGFNITDVQLQEVAELSEVLEKNEDFLEPGFRARCEAVLPNIAEIEPKDAANAYLYLKTAINETDTVSGV